MVVIAHRLSTVQTTDEVAVVQGGVIAERGSHDGLLAAGGVFAALVRRQLLGAGGSAPRVGLMQEVGGASGVNDGGGL